MAMVAVAVVAMLLIIATTFKVKERPEFHLVDKPLNLFQSVMYTFTSKAFLWLVAANFMSILISSIVTGSLFYLADYVLQVPAINLLACLFIPLIIGVPITNLFRRKLGVVGAQQLLLIIAGIGLLLIMIVPTGLIYVCVAVAGFGLSGPQTLTNVLFAQVADEDELRSGVRREGVFFGVNALITKPAQSIALAMSPFILEATGFITRQQNLGEVFLDQPASAIWGIKIIVGLVPGIALLLGALILTRYPLRGKYLVEMQRRVLDLHAQKHAQLENQVKSGTGLI
jgi:GPH family glycoside/pentoside/hexuronide:cation symporter